MPDSGPVIIIPCFNRKAITLGCSRRLTDTGASAGFRVLVVDDASTDGTAKAIARDFPEAEVLHGCGELYWTGAMELGMRHAVSQGASRCLWLNEDLIVVDAAIGSIVELAMRERAKVTAQGIIQLTNSESWYTDKDLRNSLKTARLERSSTFFSEKSARQHLDIYSTVLGRKTSSGVTAFA